MPSNQSQHFRCSACGLHTVTPIPMLDSNSIAACPSCGLTAEEGQNRLNDELSRMFTHGLQLSGGIPAPTAAPPQIVSSATLAAIGYGTGSGGMTDSGRKSPVPSPSVLGYNVSQHYHHSMHITPPARDGTANYGYGGESEGSSESAGAVSTSRGIPQEDMDMESTVTQSQVSNAEPYMKSGYEYLAERDYNRQAQTQAQIGPVTKENDTPRALNPAFSSKEWWREFQPVEFQYGMFQQMVEGPMYENEVPNEDEQMAM